METLCNYHVGETVLSLQKATLIPGGSESLVYTTLSGGIGMLVPFTSREVKISQCSIVEINEKLQHHRVKTSSKQSCICVKDCASSVISIWGLNYPMWTQNFSFLGNSTLETPFHLFTLSKLAFHLTLINSPSSTFVRLNLSHSFSYS